MKFELTRKQKEIILGSLLGDASIKGKSKTKRYLSITHSDKQKTYIMWLYEQLKDICPSIPKPYITKNNKYIYYTLISTPTEYFFDLKRKFYTPKKTIISWWLNQITPLSIAIWYMDDGSLNYKNKNKSYYSFATHSFSYNEQFLLKTMMKTKYSIDMFIKSIKRGQKHQYILIVADNSFDDFTKLIIDYIPQFMRYKLPGSEFDKKLRQRIKNKITKKELYELYYNQQLTQKQIGIIYNVHRLTISKYMNLYNFKPRNNCEAQLKGVNNSAMRLKNGRFYSRNNTLSENKKIKIIFKQLRNQGFPYPIIKKEEAYISIIEGLFHKSLKLVKKNTYNYSKAGLTISSDLCPQIFAMASFNSISPIEIFNNDDLLLDVISRTLKYAKKETIAAIRNGLKTYKNNRSVGNFPPLNVKAIINHLGINNAQSLLDFSSGFGTRLIGTYISNINRYVGIDPLTENIISLNKIEKLIKQHSQLNNKYFSSEIFNDKAENILPVLNEKFDIVLTSPPYFKKEIYDNNKNQCYIKYNKYNEWLNQWLKVVLENSYKLLNSQGYMCIFMGDFNKFEIKKDCQNLLNNISNNSFKQKIDFELPSLEYHRKNKIKKYDSCFIIQKQ